MDCPSVLPLRKSIGHRTTKLPSSSSSSSSRSPSTSSTSASTTGTANATICETTATALLAEYDARKIAREQAKYINELIGSDFIEAEPEELPYTEAIPVKEEIEPPELPSEPFTIDKNE